MSLNIPLIGPYAASDSKAAVEESVRWELINIGLEISQRHDKPWGIEIKIKEGQAQDFLHAFFDVKDIPKTLLLAAAGPKILLVSENKRFSWHVHERKDAFLRVLCGQVAVTTSATDDESEPQIVMPGTYLHIPELIRHRLGSVSNWAIIAEISRNVFPDRPSDDNDTRRIKDDYGRLS